MSKSKETQWFLTILGWPVGAPKELRFMNFGAPRAFWQSFYRCSSFCVERFNFVEVLKSMKNHWFYRCKLMWAAYNKHFFFICFILFFIFLF